MNVYVKEYKECLTIGMITSISKDNIFVYKYLGQNTTFDEYVIVSKNDTNTEILGQAEIIIYEDFFSRIVESVLIELNYRYDYYYLRNALIAAKKEDKDTIVTGSSYGLFGIDRKQLKSEVNLSLSSQDLYYSTKGIYEVCKINKNIKTIVLNCGYYYFHTDLSKMRNEIESVRLSKVYEPLFNDLHNTLYLKPKENYLVSSNIVDVNRLMELYSISEYDHCYFYEGRPIEFFRTIVWEDETKMWKDLTEEEKIKAGEIRAQKHNKCLKYTSTLKENEKILSGLSRFCEDRNINLVIVVTPVSRYYKKNLSEKFKEEFYNLLNRIEGTIHLLDEFDNENFLDEDFNDMDHLNGKGATKMTSLLLEVLNQI